MRVRVVKDLPAQLEGFNLTRYERDGAYDIAGSLGDLLVAYGFAVPDDTAPSRSELLRAFADATVAPANRQSADELREQPPDSVKKSSTRKRVTRRR